MTKKRNAVGTEKQALDMMVALDRLGRINMCAEMNLINIYLAVDRMVPPEYPKEKQDIFDAVNKIRTALRSLFGEDWVLAVPKGKVSSHRSFKNAVWVPGFLCKRQLKQPKGQPRRVNRREVSR
jgi:hypothetical protein